MADPCPDGRRYVREDRLLPWADYLFKQMAKLQPSDFADAVRTSYDDERVQAVSATRPTLPIANLAIGWSIATPRQKHDLLVLLFEKLWVRRAPKYKTDTDPVDVIESYVPRADYPLEVVGLVSLLVGAEGSVRASKCPRPQDRTAFSQEAGREVSEFKT